MEWVASTFHTTSEHGVSSMTTADARTSAASSRLNWHLHRFKGTCLFCQKTKSVFCVCAVTFQMQSTSQSPEPCSLNCQCLKMQGQTYESEVSLPFSVFFIRTEWN
jgi:hypothetical protein